MNVEQYAREKIGFAFIHGAGLNRGIWEKVAAGLDNPCLMVDFPLRNGKHESARKLSLHDYTAYIQRQLEEWKVERFVIVAHSLGAIPALRAAAELRGRLVGFAAVGAAIPKKGGSFISVLPFPGRILMPVLLRFFGTRPPESVIRSSLCSGLSQEQTEEIVRNFTPEPVGVYTGKLDVSVPSVPKLYIKLMEDKEFSQSLQDKMILNLSPQQVKTLNTGHLPMISDPDGLIEALRSFLAEWILPNSKL
ncbi:alpha/beta fold hydrolase [Paenibacillus jiagnxiensis]|uniref:alpha/beta fold hydrolase n=1 Tax=Paenibacillus jiagnxiensis TaxID=3228926 RepID=UPI0033AF8DAB